jgi:hypothetical protein
MNIVVTRRRRVTVHSYTRIAIALLCSFLAACTHSGPAAPVHEPDAKPLQRVRVLTYNTLHGLEPSGLTVKASESKEARQARLDLQFHQLSVVQPDLLLLQEVNPLPEMAEAYVTGLKDSGLQYAEVHQVDACGVRLAPARSGWLEQRLGRSCQDPLRVRK